jgi:hypothetical protein
MSRLVRLPAVAVAAVLLAGCTNSGKKAAPTTTSSSSTSSTVVLTSNSKIAAALDASIVTGQQVQAALGLSAAPPAYAGTASAPAPPQGPLSLDGVAAVFPSPAYKGLLEQGQASVGANRSYLVQAGSSGYVLDILAVKFKDGTTGSAFVTSATQLALTFGGGKSNPHPEVKVGVTPGAVLVVPPAGTSQSETVVIAALYSDGVYYLVSTSAPRGSVKDETVIKVLRAQDANYQANKASIDTAG